jgi:hypothetical protein
MVIKAGRSWAAALAEVPHQLHGGRRADLEEGSLPAEDPPSTAHTVRSGKSQDRGTGSEHLTADHNGLNGVSSAGSTELLHTLAISQKDSKVYIGSKRSLLLPTLCWFDT